MTQAYFRALRCQDEDGRGLLGLLIALFIIVVFFAVAIPLLRSGTGETVLDENLRSLVSQVNAILLDGSGIGANVTGTASASVDPVISPSLSSSLEQFLLEEAADDHTTYKNPYGKAGSNTAIVNTDVSDLPAETAAPAVLITKSETYAYDKLAAMPPEAMREQLAGTLIVYVSADETDVKFFFVTKEGHVSKASFHLTTS
ncbi:MAG: hypothetical protein M1274_10350 [Actinobacteria bacterium]|nr:hypothetical protein [Actinomycetota bacterium]